MTSDLEKIRSYLQKTADQFSDNAWLSIFHHWQSERLNPVQVLPISKVEGLQAKLEELKKDLLDLFKVNLCYSNAYELASSTRGLPDPISYVEGFWLTNHQTLAGHAWNSWRGLHFDVTGELAKQEFLRLGVSQPSHSYFKIIELSPDAAVEASIDSVEHGPLQVTQFLALHGLLRSALPSWAIVEKRTTI